jgi:hypothetical protein
LRTWVRLWFRSSATFNAPAYRFLATAAFKQLRHLSLRQSLDESILSHLKNLQHLECSLPVSVLQEGERQILPAGLKSLVLWNGRLAPVLKTLKQLNGLELRYFEDTYLDEEPVRGNRPLTSFSSPFLIFFPLGMAQPRRNEHIDRVFLGYSASR